MASRQRSRTGVGSQAAAAAQRMEAAVEAQLPPSDEDSVPFTNPFDDEVVSEIGRDSPPVDPWQNGSDPWSLPTPPETAQPSIPDYEAFCAWWRRQRESGDSQQRPHRTDGHAGVEGDDRRPASWDDPRFSSHGQEHTFGRGRDTRAEHGGQGQGVRAPQHGRGRAQDNRAPHGARDREAQRRPFDPGQSENGSYSGTSYPDSPFPDPPPSSGGGISASDDDFSARTSEVRRLLMRRLNGNDNRQERPKSSLGSVRIEDFGGERGKYRSWRRVVRAQQQLYRLEEQELAMLIYLSCKREARDVLDQLTIEDMVAPGGLAVVWKVLDEAYSETSEEHFERVELEFNNYRRIPGQSIAAYLSQIKRLRAEYAREDPETVLSSRAWAQRLLMRAALSKRERLDVFYSAGGVYEPRSIEAALRHRCQKVHEEERRLPQGNTSAFKRSRFSAGSTRSTSTTTLSSAPTVSTIPAKSRGKGRGHPVHLASIDEEASQDLGELEDEDEDLEQDPEAYEAYLQDRQANGDEVPEEPEDEEDCTDDEVTHEELKEAWAAGWRAKDQVAEKRKGRNFKGGGSKYPRREQAKQHPDQRKVSTTCGSCGARGHWKGDPECPKVQSGEDQPFVKKAKNGVHYVSMPAKTTPDRREDIKMHEVNFSFVAGTVTAPAPPRAKERRAERASSSGAHRPPCECGHQVLRPDKFCSQCGRSLANHPMVDLHEKRSADRLEYPDAHVVESSGDEGFEKVEEKVDGVMTAAEALAALPKMTKKEKRELMKWLKADQVKEELIPTPKPTLQSPYPGFTANEPEPPGHDLPESLRKKKMEVFRRELYNARVDKHGKLKPSEGAPFPNEEQRHCHHPWGQLKWMANQHGHYARCRVCNLKNVICWHEQHGSYMTQEQDFLPQNGILAIGDSGCKTAVGGCQWHKRFQAALRERGYSWEEVAECETFKFGAGEPIRSTRAYIYPVGLHGVNSFLRMSEVGEDASDCPGLVGPADMARWKVVFRFGDKLMDAMGVTKPMRLTSTRHPGLDLLDFSKDDNFKGKKMMALKRQLVKDPCAFAFLAGWEDEDVESESAGPDEVASSDEEMNLEVAELLKDMESLAAPMKPSPGCVHFGGYSDREETEVETTDHDFGVEWSEEDESQESEVDVQEQSSQTWLTLWAGLGAMATLTKGKKRRLKHSAREIKESFYGKKFPIPRAPERPRPKAPVRPYKVLEIFTWTMAVTMMAVSRGWQGCEPVSLPRWDLRKPEDRQATMQYVMKEQPDLLVIAWPCTVWSPLQYLGTMTEERYNRLLTRQQEDRECFLSLVHDLVQYQRSVGRAHLGENPWPSRAWKEPFITAAYEGESYGRVDMCRYGLRKPDTKKLLMKPTGVAGTPEIVASCAARCQCTEPHDHTLGSFIDATGRRKPVAEFAGGYTKAFAKKIVLGAEQFLDNWSAEMVQVYAEGGVAEESFMDADDEVPDIEDDLEKELERDLDPKSHERYQEPVPHQESIKDEKTITEVVAKMHRRLGHPSNEALVRMLKLSGAPKETLECAGKYQCPVCESMSMPEKPYLQNVTPRPAGFNVEVHLDLKYAKNIKNETFVALSMICAGTNKHQAVLLKTRRASYVAKKFIKHWIGVFGRPTRIVIDQGGEFEAEFILMLENHGIHSTTTGSHAGWQHALAERHGGLLGTTWHALIVENEVVSRQDMAVTLAAACEAKNEVVTRRGYSPNMLVYGKHITYPELLGEEEYDQVTQAQSFDVGHEMTKRSQMRHQARQMLLRDDVQQKLRRALQRRPASSETVYLPGQTIFFFVPHPNKPRYRRDHGRWRGPAVVLLQESHQRYFVSWRGRCLLLAAPNMRLASLEESASREWLGGEMDEFDERMKEEGMAKDFQDMTGLKEPPHQPKPSKPRPKKDAEALRLTSGLKSIKKMFNKNNAGRQRRLLGVQDAARRKRLRMIEDGSVGAKEVADEEKKDEGEDDDIYSPSVLPDDFQVPDEGHSPEHQEEAEFWDAIGRDHQKFSAP